MTTNDFGQIEAARQLCAGQEYAAAAGLLAEVLLRSPTNFAALILTAQLHLHMRDFTRAFAAAATAARVRPYDADALYTLGRIHKARGELGEAESCYRRAVEANPFDPNLLTSFGVLLRGKGQLDEAIVQYRRALAVKPDHVEAHHNLGNALVAAGAAGQASIHHESSRAVLSEELSRARASATRMAREGNLEGAIGLLKAALRIAPGAADIWLQLSAIAMKMGAASTALPNAEEAVRLDPTCYEAIEMARRLSIIAGLPDRTAHYTQLSYSLVPSEETLIASQLFLPAIQSSVESIHATRRAYEQGLDAVLRGELSPGQPGLGLQPTAFYLAYHGENDRDLQVKAAQMHLKLTPDLQMTAAHCAAGTRRPGRIRVGFISKYLCAHSIGKTTRGLVEKLERDRFEVYALRITPSVEDETTRLICGSADRAIVLNSDFAQAREQVAALGLDILFYQDIGMEPMSYFLAFARLACVQCVSFGHPDTTGIPNMDYFVSSDLFELPEADSHYSEKLFLLHDLPTLAYYYKPPRSANLNRASFGIPAGSTLYLCPQTLFKIHPDFDHLARGILERDPRGIVAFIAGTYEQWTELLRRRFASSMGAVADRVMFLPGMDLNVFLELLAAADVILDPVHFNGMNSSLESFSVGTPVVTLPAKLQRGRHTQAMYRKMGVLDCIAENDRDYIDIAVRIGTDNAYAQNLRSRILASNHVLFEDMNVVREFERFFVESLREKSAAGRDVRRPND